MNGCDIVAWFLVVTFTTGGPFCGDMMPSTCVVEERRIVMPDKPTCELAKTVNFHARCVGEVKDD